MLGDSSDLTSAAGEGTAGLIPRICVELFQRFGLSSGGAGGATENAFRGNGQASIKVSFCEVRERALLVVVCISNSRLRAELDFDIVARFRLGAFSAVSCWWDTSATSRTPHREVSIFHLRSPYEICPEDNVDTAVTESLEKLSPVPIKVGRYLLVECGCRGVFAESNDDQS